ncbi:DUF2092 domain-containing protein [bacterium]|nr:MAG: DUF2092 domain-containing protein [bacterium]
MASRRTMIVAALLALQAPQEAPSAGPIISQMLARYANAVSAQGSIVTTQTALSAKVTTTTEIALEKPNRLRIDQSRTGGQKGEWLVISDGNRFAYDRPRGVFGKKRFNDVAEATLPDLYTAVLDSIGEKSIPLDIVIGRKNDLQAFVGMLGPMALTSGASLKGESVELAKGKYRKTSDAKFPAGDIEIVITPAGDLRRITTTEQYSNPQNKQEAIVVTTVFDVNIKIDVQIQGDPFKVQ